MLRLLKRNTKGAALVEFSISAILFLIVVFGVMEWTFEVYARHASDRSLSAALSAYAVDHDESAAQAAAVDQGGFVAKRCVQPLEFRLYDSISGVDMSSSAPGYAPVGDATDDTAVFAKITLTCIWDRLTPMLIATLGDNMTHAVSGYVKLR